MSSWVSVTSGAGSGVLRSASPSPAHPASATQHSAVQPTIAATDTVLAGLFVMRLVTVLAFCALLAASAAALASAGAVRQPDLTQRATKSAALEVVRTAADSLIARRRVMPGGGWAWRSSIQAPHFHTDRDVGAASVGEGLLAAYAVTRDRRYLRGAEAAGDFLLEVAERVDNGLRWPDWADPGGRRSATHFTSFDDGAAGISDFLWRLFDVTRKPRFRAAALAGMRWVVARAEGSSCPDVCAWRWTDDPEWRRAYHGVGMGEAGIVWALDVFADRTGRAVFRRYARAGAARLRVLTDNGAWPLPEGSDSALHGTGFLAGSAGAAAMFLERHRRDRNPADLATARALLRWVNDRAVVDGAGRRWPISADRAWTTPGFELGAAGIAWVNLEAYRATGARAYRDTAREAARWLRSVAERGSWSEDPGDPDAAVFIGLDSGAAGIGWVLDDLAGAGIDTAANGNAAWAALDGLRRAAGRDRLGAFWNARGGKGGRARAAEPSWHWGSAGIAAFAARLAGWSGRTPGGQPSGG